MSCSSKVILMKQCMLPLGLVFAVVACSSDSSDTPLTDTAAPATPAAPAAMQTMAGETMTSGALTPASNSTTEAPPTNVDLRQPAGAMGGSGADPIVEAPSGPAPAEMGAPLPSAGCSSAQPVASGRFTLDVAGNPRDYILALPQSYDPTRPYRLVFTWHPGGGTAQQTANSYYGLRQLAQDSAIFVSPEGIDNGWANTGGRDLAFLDAMLDRFRGELCMDETRIFSTGFSYGGMMSYAIACGRADVFRAIAPMSGALYSGCDDGNTPIAMFGFHGTTDTVVPIANGVRARDVIAGRNGCQPGAMAVEADGCLSFQGCSEGHPVTWCEFNGGHMPAPQSAPRIWNFFSQF
jgi:polyhydroxybutyrate depolymerase